MGFMEITEKMLNSAFTENGDKAYHTSGSYCLDYFALVGGMRFNLSDALIQFDHTWESPLYPKCDSIVQNYYYKKHLYVKNMEKHFGQEDN